MSVLRRRIIDFGASNPCEIYHMGFIGEDNATEIVVRIPEEWNDLGIERFSVVIETGGKRITVTTSITSPITFTLPFSCTQSEYFNLQVEAYIGDNFVGKSKVIRGLRLSASVDGEDVQAEVIDKDPNSVINLFKSVIDTYIEDKLSAFQGTYEFVDAGIFLLEPVATIYAKFFSPSAKGRPCFLYNGKPVLSVTCTSVKLSIDQLEYDRRLSAYYINRYVYTDDNARPETTRTLIGPEIIPEATALSDYEEEE